MLISDSNFPSTLTYPRLTVGTARERLSSEQRQALIDLISVARSVRFDIDSGATISGSYLAGVGRQLVEVAQFFDSYAPRDWDKLISALE